MSAWIWAGILVVAAWAAHWGSERLSEPLKKLRRQWGFSAAAGGAIVALATASPEVGSNITSAVRGVGGIGLGILLASNIMAIPIMVAVAYAASRRMDPGGRSGGQGDGEESSGGSGGSGQQKAHGRHREESLLRVKKEGITVLALPYLAIVALVAALFLPAPLRGLQPVDGWIMLATYLAFLGQALFRVAGRKSRCGGRRRG